MSTYVAHHLDLRRVHHFTDDEEIVFISGLAHDLQPFFAEALKRIRRGAWFEGSGAHDFCARLGNRFCHCIDLFGGFDGAGTRSNDQFVATDGDAASEIDDGTLRLELTAGEFEGLRDAYDFADTFEKFEVAMIEIAMDADGAENGVGCAGGAMYIEAAGDDTIDDVLDLLVGGVFVHDDDHG